MLPKKVNTTKNLDSWQSLNSVFHKALGFSENKSVILVVLLLLVSLFLFLCFKDRKALPGLPITCMFKNQPQHCMWQPEK